MLFLKFAKIEIKPDAVLAFINQYGPLWWPNTDTNPLTIKDYLTEICALRRLIHVWRAAGEQDAAALEKVLIITDDRIILRPFLPAESSKSSGGADEAIFTRTALRRWWSTGTGQHAALFAAANAILPACIKGKTGGIELFPAELIDGRVRIAFGVRRQIDAMWIQFAMAIESMKELRECQECGEPLDVSNGPNSHRIDVMFCSSACTMRDYRRRRKQAIALRKAGQNLREIAKVLRTDTKTVKGWLKAKDEK